MSAILQQLQRLAVDSPDITAIVGSNDNLSWSALHRAVNNLSSAFHQKNILGLHLQNSPAWLVSDLAAIKSGIRNIPLPTFFSDRQLIHAVSDAGINTIITDDPEHLIRLVDVTEQSTLNIAGQELTLIRVQPDTKKSLKHTDKVTYTSGTTGTPRGVILPLRHIEKVAHSLCEASQANSDDRALVMLPLSTLLENIGSLYVPILAGAQIIVPDPSETGLSGSSGIDINAFASMLKQYRPTTMILPPQLLKLVIGLAARGQCPSSFRYIAVGGAPVGSTLLAQAKQLGLPVYQGYGLSEACSVVAVNTPAHQRSGSVGKPLPHNQLQISEEGEIILSGTLFEGYLNHTEQRESELRTGDLGYLDDDGYLYITGRSKDAIITSYSRNISPEWLESELQAHPDIAQAAVFGNSQPFLSAILVPSQAMQLRHEGQISRLLYSLSKTLAEINTQLPDYAKIIGLIIADQPFSVANGELTANGRPRRKQIELRYLNQISEIYIDQHEHIL